MSLTSKRVPESKALDLHLRIMCKHAFVELEKLCIRRSHSS